MTNHNHPNTDADIDDTENVEDEPYLPIAVTTIHDAATQLRVLADLLDPLSDCLRTHLRATLTRQNLRNPAPAVTWLRASTETTSRELATTLHDTGIIICRNPDLPHPHWP